MVLPMEIIKQTNEQNDSLSYIDILALVALWNFLYNIVVVWAVQLSSLVEGGLVYYTMNPGPHSWVWSSFSRALCVCPALCLCLLFPAVRCEMRTSLHIEKSGVHGQIFVAATRFNMHHTATDIMHCSCRIQGWDETQQTVMIQSKLSLCLVAGCFYVQIWGMKEISLKLFNTLPADAHQVHVNFCGYILFCGHTSVWPLCAEKLDAIVLLV